uniref:uncharacterized protein LOC108951006 n=1 Tax=Ciona intestinalis TaxID=7719 RepID=UPI000EF44E2F|nr:uncharacterized protein LOC108951006 [Ciona intestinalis]|eukprot:XP_018672880.2 uncharacterized protein LOC108951006 [Ciona intestinalis]
MAYQDQRNVLVLPLVGEAAEISHWKTVRQNTIDLAQAYLQRLNRLHKSLELPDIEAMRRSCHYSCVKTASHSSYCPSRQIHHTTTPRCGWLNLRDCGNLERYHNNREAHLLNLKRIREFQKYPIRPQLTPLHGVRITTEPVNGKSEFPLKQEDKNRDNNHFHTKDTSCSLKNSRVKQFSDKKIPQPVLYHVHWMRGHNIATALPKYTATFRNCSRSGKPIVKNIIAQNAKLRSSLFRRINENEHHLSPLYYSYNRLTFTDAVT